MPEERYHRQMILPVIGPSGQARLAQARVLLVGVGALGGTIADQLVRAGVGHLRLVDRDLVDATNLHRQVLFTESDASHSVPKAAAGAARLSAINSSVTIEPLVVDVHAGNIEQLAGLPRQENSFSADLILDGTDNAETRYLINDLAVKHGISWVYGACVGTEGRILPIVPGQTPCLRCLFPEPPRAGELQTCDTAGVLGAAAAVVAALQAAAAIRLLVERAAEPRLLALDAWSLRVREMNVAQARQEDCPACSQRRFDFLAQPVEAGATTLCGRNAVQVRSAAAASRLDLAALSRQLAVVGEVETTPFLVRCRLAQPQGIRLSVFTDGRALVEGTSDLAIARSVVARFLGS